MRPPVTVRQPRKGGRMGSEEPQKQDSQQDQQPAGIAANTNSEPPLAAVGVAIARARRAAGLTQRELADKLDVRLWMVDEWEAGAKPIAPDQLEQIAAAVGTTTPRLLGRDDAPGAQSEQKPTEHPPAQQPPAQRPVKQVA